MLSLLLPSWFNYNFTRSLSFQVSDGWCKLGVQGLGEHCFGDFYYPIRFASTKFPWDSTINPYTPIATWVFAPFSWLNSLGGNSTLLVYLVLILVATCVPIYVFRGSLSKNQNHRSIIYLVAFTCSPILVSVDRGNLITLTVPLLFFLIKATCEKNPRKIFVLLSLLFQLKPQFAILSIIIFTVSNSKMWLKWVGLNAGILLLTFLCYGNNAYHNINSWFNQLISYQSYGNSGSLFPVNISLNNTLHILMKLLGMEQSMRLIDVSLRIIAIVLGITIFVFRKRYTGLHLLMLMLSYILLFINTTFHYYYVVFAPIFLLYFYGSLTSSKNEMVHEISSVINRNKYAKTIFHLFFFIVMIPWAIPWSLFIGGEEGFRSTSIHWAISQPMIILIFLSLLSWKRTVMHSGLK